jgi:hypothetical protein
MGDSGSRGGEEHGKPGFIPIAAHQEMQRSSKSRPDLKPDYVLFCEQSRDKVVELLGEPVPMDDIGYAFSPRWAHYFVLGNFRHFNDNVDRIFRALREALAAPSYPSRACLGALYHTGPLSLFEILRLHHAFEFIRNSSTHSEISRLLHRDAEQPLIEPRSVLPSLRFVDPERLRSFRASKGLKERDVLREAATFLRVTLPPRLLSESLEVGEKRRGPLRPYRITTALAIGICAAFVETRDVNELRAEADDLFPADLRSGGGHGQYTVTLTRAQGNQVRLL